MALSGLVDKMDEFINRGDMYICNNKPQTAKGCYLKAFEKAMELEKMNEDGLESYISKYKSKISERIKECDRAPPTISRPPSSNTLRRIECCSEKSDAEEESPDKMLKNISNLISEGDKLYKKQKYKKALTKYKEVRNECLNVLLIIIPDPKYTYEINDYINEMNNKIEDCLSPPMKYSVKLSSSSSCSSSSSPSLSFSSSKLPLIRKSTPNSKSDSNNNNNNDENIENIEIFDKSNQLNESSKSNNNTNPNNNENNNDNSDTYILPSLTTVSGVFYNGKKLIRKANYLESKCRFHDASICLKESVKVLKPLIIRELKEHEKEPLCFYISESELKLSKLSYYPPVESQKDMLSKIQLYITDGDLLLSLVDPIKSYLNYKIALNILNGLNNYVKENEEKNLECVLRDDIELKEKDVNSKLEEIDLIKELINHELNGNKNREVDRDESIREYMKCREVCIKLEEYHQVQLDDPFLIEILNKIEYFDNILLNIN